MSIKYKISSLSNKTQKMKSRKSHAIEQFNIVSAACFAFCPRNIVIGHLWDEFKKQACAELLCCYKKSAITETDLCKQVEKQPTRIRNEII